MCLEQERGKPSGRPAQLGNGVGMARSLCWPRQSPSQGGQQESRAGRSEGQRYLRSPAHTGESGVCGVSHGNHSPKKHWTIFWGEAARMGPESITCQGRSASPAGGRQGTRASI